MKQCARCRNHKSLDDFGIDNSRRDGRYPYCRDCNNAKSRAYNSANPGWRRGRQRGTKLKAKYCHVTGAVRSLLCRKCNTGLGIFKEDPKLLVKAAGYIDFHLSRGYK
jgi:hypothetical protein